MANDLITKWAKYYEDNGLQWLASQHVAAIKQAFFAGAEAVEQPLAPDGETHLCGGKYYTDKVLGEVCCRCQAPRR